jgi:hypothetical protein
MNGARRLAVPAGVVALAVGALHAAGFGGWWLGDDLANLQQFHADQQQGRMLEGSLAAFAGGLSPSGSFYRPLSIVSLSANHALAGDAFAGWYLANFVVHLANSLLVVLLAARLAHGAGAATRWAPAVGGLAFGLAPSLCEGVFWISARADGWVTLLCLLATLAWCDADRRRIVRTLAVPGLLALALLFKESAAVLPLQSALLALAWPARTNGAQRATLAAGFVLVAAFLLLRVALFGNAWQVYAAPDAAARELGPAQVVAALASFGPWWSALTSGTPWFAAAYPLLLAATLVFALACTDAPGRRLALACGAAACGMMLAAVLNLHGMPPEGEGGRLTYTPMAWLAAGLGAALARTTAPKLGPIAGATALLAIAVGAWVAHGVLGQARAAQDGLRALAAALPAWADTHAGASLVVMPVRVGPVVFALNAQAGLALQPIQPRGVLHRTLPTLPDELATRHAQLAAGALTRVEAAQPQWLDTPRLLALSAPAEPTWPLHFACWSATTRRLHALPTPPRDDALAWRDALRAAVRERCGY